MSQPWGQAASWLTRRLTLRVQLTLWYVALLGLVLLGFCAILDTSLKARLQSQLSIIQTEAARLGGLVADMLALARADSHADPMTWEAVALDSLLLGVVDQMTMVAEVRRVALVVGQIETVEVIGDSSRLAQMVINVVDNALKHTPANGSVRIDLTREGAWAVITITDTGIGIAEEHLPHLFERFYRVDRARTGDGTGLGLAIGDWIARAHHGKILVKSAVGKGSAFRVFLPVKQ